MALPRRLRTHERREMRKITDPFQDVGVFIIMERESNVKREERSKVENKWSEAFVEIGYIIL